MLFQEPKVEFIKITQEDMISCSTGQETHMCGGTSFQPDQDVCSQDPSMF